LILKVSYFRILTPWNIGSKRFQISYWVYSKYEVKKYMKILLQAILILTSISCSKVGDAGVEALLSLGLLGTRQTATIDGTFYGIYNANVKAVALGTDGKCKPLSSGNGEAITSGKGEFSINYKRFSESGGSVCIMAYPKEDGTSRFFAVDQQREITWSGQDKFQILVLPEPSTTKRSEFSVVSTPFNRMAIRRLERLALGNSDPSKTGEYLKTANRQIVSQFGLSRGLSKSARASSVELATPELTSLKIDFSDTSNPETLKFIIMIGGLHKLAIPEKPETYEEVVSVVSEYLSSGTGSSVSESGKPLLLPKDKVENGGTGKPLSPGNSLSTQVSAAVNSFLIDKAAELGIPASSIAEIAAQIVVQDKPPFGPTAPPSQEKFSPPTVTYTQSSYTYSIFDKFSIIPDYKDASIFILKSGASEPVFPAGMTLNSTTGEITWVPTDAIIATYKEARKFDFKIIASGKGGETTTPISIELVPKATINIVSNNNCSGTSCKYNKGSLYIKLQTTGVSTISGSGSLPSGVTFNASTREISGATPGTCSNCSYTVEATDKLGGKTSLTITFVETPTFTLPYATYRFVEGDNLNLQISDIRATNSFSINTYPTNNSILISNLGVISGIPATTIDNTITIDVTANGNGGNTLKQTFKVIKSPGAPICKIGTDTKTSIQITQFASIPTIKCETAFYTGDNNQKIQFNATNWTYTNLPKGLTVVNSATNITISGTPQDVDKTYSMQVSYTTLSGDSQVLTIPITLSPVSLSLSCSYPGSTSPNLIYYIGDSVPIICTANPGGATMTNWNLRYNSITKSIGNSQWNNTYISLFSSYTGSVSSNGQTLNIKIGSTSAATDCILNYDIQYTDGSGTLRTINSGDSTFKIESR
jgi:hypothetical protein